MATNVAWVLLRFLRVSADWEVTLGSHLAAEQSYALLLAILVERGLARCDGNSVENCRRAGRRQWFNRAERHQCDAGRKADGTGAVRSSIQQGRLELILKGRDGTRFAGKGSFQVGNRLLFIVG